MEREVELVQTYETAHDFMSSIVDFHAQAAQRLSAAQEQCNDERNTMALCYLHDYQQRMQQSLAHYLQDSEQHQLLDTWLTFSLNAEPTPDEFLSTLAIESTLSSTDLLKLGQALADYVVSVLEVASASIDSLRLSVVVDSLLMQESNERKKLTRAMNSLNEI